MKSRFPLLGLFLLLGSVTLPAQSADFFPLDQVKPGLKGVGKTIFQGAKIEEFSVEILGVLENISPRRNLIMARLSGEKVEATNVFAGMSGSPVYIDGKLLGAVAYAFAFSKEPIAGITPIEEMVDIFKERPAQGKIARRASPDRSIDQLLRTSAGFSGLLPAAAPAGSFEIDSPLGMEGRLTPIASPVSLSGFSEEALRAFAPQFRALGLAPVAALGSGRASDFGELSLAPGSTVAVQLIRGDMDASASGTLTYLSGNRLYAFGHPFLGNGYTDMPISKGAVVTVISSLSSSQKVTATGDFVGSIKQDRATGILGLVGEKAEMLPIKVNLHTSRNEDKELNFEVIRDSFLTPFLTTLAVYNSITSSERTIGDQTLRVRCVISIKDQPEVRFENSVADPANGTVSAALAAAAPVNFLLGSGFDDLHLERVDVDVSVVEQTRTAELDKVWIDKVEVLPGQEVKLSVFLRKPNGETLVESYPLKIPEEISPGPLEIVVGDGMSINRAEADDEGSFIPENINQLIRAINNLKKNDRLYIRLSRSGAGVVVGGEGLPDLPPSMLELYRSSRTAGDARPIRQVVYVEHELPATHFVLNGQKTVKLRVKG